MFLRHLSSTSKVFRVLSILRLTNMIINMALHIKALIIYQKNNTYIRKLIKGEVQMITSYNISDRFHKTFKEDRKDIMRTGLILRCMVRVMEDEKVLERLDDEEWWELYEKNKTKHDLKDKNMRLFKQKYRATE